MKDAPITFICPRCDAACFLDWCERWEVQLPCHWCPECEAEYPIFEKEMVE